MAREKKFIPVTSPETIRSISSTAQPAVTTNNVLFVNEGDRVYARPRPGVRLWLAPSSLGTGRLYMSSATGDSWVINDTSLYSGRWSSAISPATNASTISSGLTRMEGSQLSTNVTDNIFFIQGTTGIASGGVGAGEGKWIDNIASPTQYYDMDTAAGNGGGTFTYFPPNNNLSLAHGIENLNRRIYVLTGNGQIWGSDLNDGTSWTDPLNYITAERTDDISIKLMKHKENLVVFGRNSIEFFYDAGNSVGSPLSRREDVFYDIGAYIDYDISYCGEDIVFVGYNAKMGGQSIYLLSDFNLIDISTPTIREILDTNTTTYVCGFTVYGKPMVAVTLNTSTKTYIYDVENKIWGTWTHPRAPTNVFHFTSTIPNGIGGSEALLYTGEIITFATTASNTDSFDSSDDDYGGTTSPSVYDNISMTIRLPAWDNGNHNWKYHHQVRAIGQETEESETLTINWYDERDWSSTSAGSGTIDVSDNKNKLTRLGRAKSRTYELTYAGDVLYYISGIEIEYTEGTH